MRVSGGLHNGDAVIVSFGFSAGTAVIDAGVIDVLVSFSAVGANAIMRVRTTISHNGDSVGLITKGTEMQGTTSGTFDSTVAGSFIGVSINGGTSASWTVGVVDAELSSY